jgi:hypothetical protein
MRTPHLVHPTALAACAACSALACADNAAGPSPAAELPPPMTPGAPAAGFEIPTDDSCESGALGQRTILISDREYLSSIRRLLPSVSLPEVGLGDVGKSSAFAQYTPARATRQRLWLDDTARSAAAQLATLTPCGLAQPDEACATSFLTALAERAFRRPLSAEENERVRGLYLEGEKDGASLGVELALKGILQAPSFLYRTELGQAAPEPAEVLVLTQHEIAAQLAAALLGGIPDSALQQAASTGQLSTPEHVAQQVQRLLQLAEAREQIASSVEDWLATPRVLGVSLDSEVYPEATPTLQHSMYQESRRFLFDQLWNRMASVGQLFTSRIGFVNRDLAQLYGLSLDPGEQYVEVELPEARSGLLARAAFLSGFFAAHGNSSVHRGVYLREHVLCAPVPSPPPDIQMQLNMKALGDYDRAARMTEAPCSGCHQLIETVGMAFDEFDGLGRLDPSVIQPLTELNATDVDGPVANARELGARLAQSQQVSACMVRHALGMVQALPAHEVDACLAARVHASFVAAGARLDALLPTAFADPGLYLRRAETMP